MTETIYQVLTPVGAFQVTFGDDDNPVTDYRGDDIAIQFFKDWLLLNQVSGQDGWHLSVDNLDPSDLYGFCQPPGSGITVLPPFEDLLSYVLDDQPDEQEPEDMTSAILDAATGREALQLAKELKQIRAGISELTGRAALTAAKRIREIRVALGVGDKKPDGNFFENKNGVANGPGSDILKFNTPKEVDAWLDIFGDYEKTLISRFRIVTKDGDEYFFRNSAIWENGTEYVPMIYLRDGASEEAKNMADKLGGTAKSENQKQKATITDVNAVMPLIKQFIGKSQLAAMGAGVRGEEGQFFKDKFVDVANVIEGMPKTYETDGQGDKAIAYLHYFKGAGDWYITEKDSDTDGEGQIQAFGYADLGQGGELGYISIKELIESGVELDLYWSPKSIGEIKGKADPVPESGKKGLSDMQKMEDAIISHGGEVLQDLNDSAVSFMLHGGEYYGNQPPYLKVNENGRFAVVYTIEDSPVFMSFEEDPFTAVSNYVALYDANKQGEIMTETGSQNPLKSAFIAELKGLKTETDIEAYNNRLDEIAARVEKAGLMEELDADLNTAADVLTELLAAAENS